MPWDVEWTPGWERDVLAAADAAVESIMHDVLNAARAEYGSRFPGSDPGLITGRIAKDDEGNTTAEVGYRARHRDYGHAFFETGTPRLAPRPLIPPVALRVTKKWT